MRTTIIHYKYWKFIDMLKEYEIRTNISNTGLVPALTTNETGTVQI